MKLELGGGQYPKDGYTSIDRIKYFPDTWVHDLNTGLPDIPNNSLDAIYASHCIEHIPNVMQLINACYDALKFGKQFEIIVPLAGTVGDFKTPDHVHHFVPESFDFYDLNWDYERKPDESPYGLKQWTVQTNVDLPGPYQQLFVTLTKPNRQTL